MTIPIPAVKRVTINNYRGIGEVSLELHPITIFVGRNNTGKSSIVEAIALVLSSSQGFKDIVDKRDLMKHVAGLRDGYEHLVKRGSNICEIEAELSYRSDVKNIKMTMATHEGFSELPDNIRSVILSFIDEIAVERVEAKRRRFISYFYESRALREEESGEEIVRAVEEEVESLKKGIILSIISQVNGEISHLRLVTYIDAHLLKEYDKAYRRFYFPVHARLVGYRLSRSAIDELEVDLQVKVIEELRKIIPYFWDYRNGRVIFRYGDKSEITSLGSTGEGFQAVLDLLTPIIVGARVIIIEEPENHMHPGLMERYTSVMLDSLTQGVQYIITTHSLELLELLLDTASQKELLDYVSIIRTYRMPDGDVDYEILKGKEALEELSEIGGDLRGP
ncbi:MAG: ATP-binding protein [Desulfurococcales archaeon]|nr:ATP-binding protein [Desulfurococcales archaeon]